MTFNMDYRRIKRQPSILEAMHGTHYGAHPLSYSGLFAHSVANDNTFRQYENRCNNDLL